ncbi:hypothetical protein COCOBI_01-2940 [Coccomyxa sp. Obi]|nr:hypothetical protein COCOBI_01-2940 [Coccomyxa sp. Obi]
MPTDQFDLLKSMRARMACMPGPARSSAHNEEQSQGVEVAVHAAPQSFLLPTGAARKPQNSAETAVKRSDDHSRGTSQRPQEGCPSGASDMSSLSSLHEPLPDRVDDFETTLELSRRPATAHPQKEPPQKETKKPEAPSSAAPSATLEPVSQPSQAAAIPPGVGWSAEAPSQPGAAKPKLSDKQEHHIRTWSFGDGKVSARQDWLRAAARKGKAQAQIPPGAAKAFSKQQQPERQSQQLPQKAPQQPAHQAQPEQPPRAQPHAAASAPSARPAQQRLQPVKIPAPQPQPAPATALRVKVPPRHNIAQQGPDTPAGPPVASFHQSNNMEVLPAHVQQPLVATLQQKGTTDGSLGPEAVKLLPHTAGSSERDAAAGSLDQPTLLACDEVLPETDLPLRPMPRLNMARDLGLPQPHMLETAPSVAQKFQDRLTAVISGPGRRSTSSSAFIRSTPAPGGSAFSAAGPAPMVATGRGAPGRSSAFAGLQPPRGLSAWEAALEAFCAELSEDDEEEEGFQAWRPNGATRLAAARHNARVVQRQAAGRQQQRRQASGGKRAAAPASSSERPRRRARAAAPTGFYEERDVPTSSETESEVALPSRPPPPPQPRRGRAKSRHAGHAAAAPVKPSLPCSRVATFEEVQRWKRGRPQQKKPAAAHRADVCLSPNRHVLFSAFL